MRVVILPDSAAVARFAAIQAMVEGPVTARCPASALQWHPGVTVVVDTRAAAHLEDVAYYQRAEECLAQRHPV